MLLNSRWLFIGCHLIIFVGVVQSFVLLTANVEDLKRIAQKFVSDSLANKIAQLIIDVTDDNVANKRSTSFSKIRTVTDEKEVKKKYHNTVDKNVIKQNKELRLYTIKIDNNNKARNVINEGRINHNEVYKSKAHKNKQMKIKSEKEENKMRKEKSSLEYYRESDKLHKKISNMVGLDKFDSDESNVQFSRKEFGRVKSVVNQNIADIKDDTDEETDKLADDLEKSQATNNITAEELTSEDLSFNNRVEAKSDEILSDLKTTYAVNLTTGKIRNEFDQYLNTNYPKSNVVATSGALELRKASDNIDLFDSDFE